MKRKLLLITCCLTISFTNLGCGSSNYNESNSINLETSDNGTSIMRRDSGDTYTIESIPHDISYDGKNIILDSVNLYEDKVDHGYSLYALVNFDFSDLSDDDIYWMEEDEDLDVTIYVDSEQNKFEDERMNTFSRIRRTTSDIYSVALRISDKYRYSLSNDSYNVCVNLKQGGTYKYDDSELDKTDTYYYFDLKIPEDIETTSSIDKFTYDSMVASLNNQLKNLQKYNN